LHAEHMKTPTTQPHLVAQVRDAILEKLAAAANNGTACGVARLRGKTLVPAA
jgi:hypothetical protein